MFWLGVPDRPPVAAQESQRRRANWREIGTVALVVLAGSMQIFFLPAILPQILPPLGVPKDRTLQVGGVVLFVTGLASATGAMLAPRIAEIRNERRIVPWLVAASSVLVAALALAPDAWSFSVLRFVQVLVVAPVFPIVVGAVAARASGEAIGFINSARISASFLGPIIATTLVASFAPALAFLSIAAVGLGLVPIVLQDRGRKPPPTAPSSAT